MKVAAITGVKEKKSAFYYYSQKKEKGEVQAEECRCVKLRQLCCGSYSRYMQGVVRFKNWHSKTTEPLASTCGAAKQGGGMMSSAVSGGPELFKEAQVEQACGQSQDISIVNAADTIRNSTSEAAVVGDSSVFWVFGYGSLTWKTDGLPAKERLAGYIKGFKRVFFQLSDDHRGTRSSPGLVANLLPLEVYKEFVAETAAVAQGEMQQQEMGDAANCWFQTESGRSSPSDILVGEDDEGIVHGVALKFAAADMETVINKLDYREKGGYSRILVEFFPLEKDVSQSGVTRKIHAFVYVGLPCNRYFYCFPDFPIPNGTRSWISEESSEIWEHNAEELSDALGPSSKEFNDRRGSQVENGRVFHAQESTALLCRCCPDDLAHAAGMILRGEGLSGPNTEYLFKLADFLRKIRQVDAHVFSLEARVKQMMKQQDYRHGR